MILMSISAMIVLFLVLEPGRLAQSRPFGLDLPRPLFAAGVAFVSGDTVVVAGGSNGTTASDRIFKFNIFTKNASYVPVKTAVLGLPRASMAVSVVGNMVLLLNPR